MIEAAVGGRGVALAKRALAQDDLDAGRLVAPMADATAVDFAYSVVHPKLKGRLRMRDMKHEGRPAEDRAVDERRRDPEIFGERQARGAALRRRAQQAVDIA